MSQTLKSARDPAGAALTGLAILKRMGKVPTRGRGSKAAPRETHTRRSRINPVTNLLKAIFYLALLATYLIVEVIVAMLAYIYLNLYQVETFGRLVGFCRELLNTFATQLERFSPELATQAYATLLGELGAKSVLLLFLGLGVSALIRLLGALLHRSLLSVRPQLAPSRSA
jgi:hypothetical protein